MSSLDCVQAIDRLDVGPRVERRRVVTPCRVEAGDSERRYR